MTELKTLLARSHAILGCRDKTGVPSSEIHAVVDLLGLTAERQQIAILRAILALRTQLHMPATNVVDSSSCAAKALEILEAVT